MNFSRFCQDKCIASSYLNCSINNLNESEPFAKLFLKSPFPMKLYGEPGTGKTYFMLAIIKELLDNKRIHRGLIRFINAMSLDERVEEEIKKTGSASYFIQSLKEDGYLFIDDFGIEKSRERAERNYYALLDHRLANSQPTVLSTNLKEDEILNIYGSRIFSRLKQCITVHFKGPDLRKPPKIV